MYNLIDGKKIASLIKQEIAGEVAGRIESGRKRPHLAAILVGDNGSSVTYVDNKVKDCAEVGFKSTLIRLSNKISESELIRQFLNLMIIPMLMAL